MMDKDNLNNSDKEKYSTISIADDDEVEEKTVFSKTIEIPKLIIQQTSRNIFKRFKKVDMFDNAVRYNPDYHEGLNTLQIEERKLNDLINHKTKKMSKSVGKIIFDNVFTFFNMLLLAIGILLLSVGDYKDCFFLVIITANTLIGIIQEIRAKKIVDKLSLLNAKEVKVKRDSVKLKIHADEMVLDDIYYLYSGDEIPCDSFIVKGSVEVNESSLTGESLPVKKKVGDYILAGSYLVSGSCMARCDRIGRHNYIVQLQEKASKTKAVKSVLLSSLNKIIRFVSAIVIPVGVALFFNYYFIDNNYEFALRKTGAQVVTMIPSGLFLLISTALAVSVINLSKKKTLVQDSYAIESLARSNILCLDKTGTITDGSMIVKETKVLDDKLFNEKLISSYLGVFDDDNVTSLALKKHFGTNKDKKVKCVLPFSSSRKLSAVEFENEGTYILGAPEFISLDENIKEMCASYLDKGNRVLLLAHTDKELKENMEFYSSSPVALFILEDHIRDTAADTIKWFNENDVEIKIISGDNPVAVSAIASKAGVRNYDKYISLEGKNNEEIISTCKDYTIFGRVSPEQKAVLIRAFKEQGNTVAMTGDGVNDILAMKQANCAIAMASGSEAARNSSHIVLLNSDFASMPKVVKEGRQVVNNVQRSASLFLMKTLYSMVFAALGLTSFLFKAIFGLNIPLDLHQPFDLNHLYILEFFVIGLPSVVLALLPNTELIKGSFIKNVAKKAIPGAVGLVASVLIVMIVRIVFPDFMAGEELFVTVACLALSFTGLEILAFVCMPFHKISTILYITMIIFTITWITVLPNSITSLNISLLNWKHYLLLVLIMALNSVYFIIERRVSKKKSV